MNETQRSTAVAYLAEGATLAETVGMIGASRRDFELEWTTGKRDAESAVESELGSWYLEASAARLRIRATLRAEAVECAGEKRSGDLLQVVRALEAEAEPSFSADDDVRASSPLLSLADKIAASENDAERERLRGVERDAALALHSLFAEMTKPVEVAA